MHIPLMIAVLALLAFGLLPQLDRYTGTETGTYRSLRSYLVRLAHWINL
jgi:hypothetical protein